MLAKHLSSRSAIPSIATDHLILPISPCDSVRCAVTVDKPGLLIVIFIPLEVISCLKCFLIYSYLI